jgi:hypothetical protein
LGVERDLVEQVYDVTGEAVDLVVASSRLDNMKSRATADLALLIAAGRQAIDLDQNGTSVEEVRRWAEHFKRYDASNFAATMKSLDTTMNVKGKARDRALKMTSPAWAKAGELVRTLTK